MERRTFLKNFAIGLGIVTVVPVVISEIIDIKDVVQVEPGRLTLNLLSDKKEVRLIIEKLYTQHADMNLVEFLNGFPKGRKWKPDNNKYVWKTMSEK